MTEGQETPNSKVTETTETQVDIDQSRILSADEQLRSADAAQKAWSGESVFEETKLTELEQLKLLDEKVQKGELTREKANETIAIRFAETRASANIDYVTNLENRTAGSQRTKEILALSSRKKTPTTAFMIDVDDFKLINDSLGHLAGDQALYSVADHLKTISRVSDIPFRWGGDEFFVLMPDTNVEAAVKSIGTRMIKEGPPNTSEMMEGMGYQLPKEITFSIGAAQDTGFGFDSVEERETKLTLLADKATRVSKFRGKNCITIGTMYGTTEVFSDPLTDESFTAKFGSKGDNESEEIIKLIPYKD